MIGTIVSECLVTIGMLGYSNFNSSSHRKTFNAVFWDFIAHFFHIRTDINPFFTEHSVGPVGWDVPRIVQSFFKVYHGCSRTVDMHDRSSVREVCWIVREDASTSHKPLVDSNTVGQEWLGSGGRGTFGIEGVIVLIGLIISSTYKP